MAVTPAYDVGGFGRLGEMKIARRAEERQERRLGMQEEESAQRLKMGSLQLGQMESNLATIKKQSDLKAGLGQALKNIPEGENQFTTAYNYMMMQGEPDLAMKYMDSQSDKIDQIFKMDPEGGVDAYNQTIGKATGNTIEYVKDDPIHGDVLRMKDSRTGKIQYGSRTKSGEFVHLPKYLEVVEDPSERTKTVSDLALEDEVTKRFEGEGLNSTDARLKAQALISENKKGKGITMSMDEAGNPVVTIGGKAQGPELTRGAKTGVQKDLIQANATYSDMRAIVGKVEDKYLEMPTRLGAKWTSLKEKWKVGTVTPDQKKELADYTDFRRESISSLNAYIKQITGAAMSEMEAKRLMKAMPNPGMGMFDGDSPTEFRTKLKGVMESLDRVTARNNYIAKHGLSSFKDVGLDQIDGIIDRRGEQIESGIKSKNYGTRKDGTPKGIGFLGVIKNNAGQDMTEFSVGVNINGEETDIPTLVPTLTEQEINILKSGGKLTDGIVNKAVAHAKNRISKGLSPFKEVEESVIETLSEEFGIRF